MKNKIVVIGHKGRMGSLICQRLQELRYDVLGVGSDDKLEDISSADLVVDFATADSSVVSAKWCKEKNVPLIVGATGQTQYQLQEIFEASKSIAICKAGNFSIGIAIMKNVLKEMSNVNINDCVIFEKHHKNKKDSPSGTAVELKNNIESLLKLRVEVLSERGGKEIGTHHVDFYFGDELITIKHQAFSRYAFVDGVMIAVEFMLKNTTNKLFSFEEIYERVAIKNEI